MEKSYVGMANCFFCNKPSMILIDRRLRNTLPMNVGVIDMTPCSECRSYMDKGVILISIKDDTKEEDMKGPQPNPYRTGGWVVMTDEAVERLFPTEFSKAAIKMRFMFIEDSVWNHLKIPRG